MSIVVQSRWYICRKEIMSNTDQSVEPTFPSIAPILMRLREVQSMYGDADGSVQEFMDVVEVLYRVEYREPNQDDIENLRKLADSINSEEAQDLDPSYVEEVVNEFESDIDVIEKMVEQGYFDGVPSAR